MIENASQFINEITWTMKNRSNVEPFLNEHFPERKLLGDIPLLFTVKGGTVYVTGRKVIFKERS